MLRRLPSAFAIRAVSRSNAAAARFFSSDGSHDDFKPKRAVVSDNLEECIKLVGEQVKSNDVILYMVR